MELTKHVLPKQQLSQRRAGSWVSCTLRTLSVWLGGAKTCPETSHQALALPGTPASPDLGNCVCEHILHPPLSWGDPRDPRVPPLPWVLGGQSWRSPWRSSSPAANPSLAQAPSSRVFWTPQRNLPRTMGTERAQPERSQRLSLRSPADTDPSEGCEGQLCLSRDGHFPPQNANYHGAQRGSVSPGSGGGARGVPGEPGAGGAPAPRPARPGGSRNRIRGLGRAAAAAASHGPASRAAQVHLVRLHRPGRGEERQGVQIAAQSESPERPAHGWRVGESGGTSPGLLGIPAGFHGEIVKY